MGLRWLVKKILRLFRKRDVVELRKVLISLDSNPVPVGSYKTFTAGEDITAGDVVSLAGDGNVYKSSSTYPNVVGIAIDSTTAGGSVRVLVVGVAQAVADGAINPGDRLTFSNTTAGRVVSYMGHTHSTTVSKTDAVTSVGVSTGTVVTGITKSTTSVISSISVDRRDFTTKDVMYNLSISCKPAVTDVTIPSHRHISWKFDQGQDYGYQPELRFFHKVRDGDGNDTLLNIWDSGIKGSKTIYTNSVTLHPTLSTQLFAYDYSGMFTTVVNGVTTTSGTTIVANVTSTTSTVVSDVSVSTSKFVKSIYESTAKFITDVSVDSNVGRVVGVALTSATTAGENVTVLVIPMII